MAVKLPKIFHDEVMRRQKSISDSRALSNTVATLLWQYDEKPIAHKVLQYAQKGSMSTINDELNKWWDALRERDMVRLENPKAPQSLVGLAGKFVGSAWELAMTEANSTLEKLMEEALSQVKHAEDNNNKTAVNYRSIGT